MGAKELQATLQDNQSCTIYYETVWKGKEKLLLSCMEVGRTASNFYSGGRKLFWRKCRIQLLRLISMLKMGRYFSKGSFVLWAHGLKVFMSVVDHI
jgi:hypothetical protein